jgi:hypothetical protein
MDYSNIPAIPDDNVVVGRLYDLARSGETESHEFLQLDHVMFDRLQATYGSEIQRLSSLAA